MPKSKKSPRKTRKSPRKSPRKSSRKSPRKSLRKSPRRSPRKTRKVQKGGDIEKLMLKIMQFGGGPKELSLGEIAEKALDAPWSVKPKTRDYNLLVNSTPKEIANASEDITINTAKNILIRARDYDAYNMTPELAKKYCVKLKDSDPDPDC